MEQRKVHIYPIYLPTCKFIEMVANVEGLVVKICIFIINEFHRAYGKEVENSEYQALLIY